MNIEGVKCIIELEDGTRFPALLDMEQNFEHGIEVFADITARTRVSPSIIRRQIENLPERWSHRGRR